MKTPAHSSKTIIKDGNLAELEQELTNGQLPFPDNVGLLALVADMFDDIANGKDYYMIIGATRNRSAFSVTVKAGTSTVVQVFGESLVDISQKVLDLL